MHAGHRLVRRERTGGIMIDWRKIAEQNGLTPEEFKKEIFTVAACVGALVLDEQQIGGSLKFTCSDEIGPLELLIRRGN